ncbi:MAG: RloB family protein [Candidatus Hatepunaea meridiana]|nr:RloB family protein [Candidatus Hatepunaea meridiana]
MMNKGKILKRSKSKGFQEQSPVLIIVTGQTEEKYFKDRIKDKRYTSIIVEIENSKGDSNPLKVIERYKNNKFHSYLIRKPISYKRIWFHIDFDNEPNIRVNRKPHKDANFNNACDMLEEQNSKWKFRDKKREKYRVVYSNPSFELWVLLHFKSQTAFITRHDALREVKKHLPDYEKGLRYELYASIIENEVNAIEYAKYLERHHHQIGYDTPDSRTPSSTLFYLIEQLDDEFN